MNDVSWWVAVAVGLAPIVVAVFAIWKVSREQELRAELRKIAPTIDRLVVINQGAVESRNVAVKLDALPLEDHPAYVQGERLDPTIHAKFRTSCLLSISAGVASLPIEITWNSRDDQEPRSYKSRLRIRRRDKTSSRGSP